MERDLIYNGVNFGLDGSDPQMILDMIKKRCIDYGTNFLTIYAKGPVFDQEHFLIWGKYLAENKIYFCFSHMTQIAPAGMDSRIFPETVAKLKEIAGEYFLGERFGEPGSAYACKLPGYYVTTENTEDPSQYRGKNPALRHGAQMLRSSQSHPLQRVGNPAATFRNSCET